MPTPEDLAREKIDQLLTAAGWAVQKHNEITLPDCSNVAEVDHCQSMIKELETLATANF